MPQKVIYLVGVWWRWRGGGRRAAADATEFLSSIDFSPAVEGVLRCSDTFALFSLPSADMIVG